MVDGLVCESCQELRKFGHEEDGVYAVKIEGTVKIVWCDMTTDGGGWTVSGTAGE